MTPSSEAHNSAGSQRGLSLVEIVVSVAILSIVVILAKLGYDSLNSSKVNLNKAMDMEREAKLIAREIDVDLRRAGFGLSGVTVFPILGKQQVRFEYLDLVATYCLTNETVVVTYTAGPRTLTREVSCNGRPKAKKIVSVDPDSLALTLAYTDESGAPTSTSSAVRTVEYSLDIISKAQGNVFKKDRVSKGAVSIVNNI